VNLVLDSSMTLSWCFKDERTEVSQAVLRQVMEEGALVPPLWRFEVANGLQMGVRRQRIDVTYRDETLADLDGLDIAVDPDCAALAWSASVMLAERRRLTVYDAAYLELAQRRRMRLATLDTALLQAGRAEGVPVIGI
jgi:predicted nucleic acid-binding protein